MVGCVSCRGRTSKWEGEVRGERGGGDFPMISTAGTFYSRTLSLSDAGTATSWD